MAFVETGYEHIVLNEAGDPVIAGTTMKVVEIVLEKLASGCSPEELQYQHPYLTLGQIYSALAFYEDQREAVDRDIERRLTVAEEIRRRTLPSPFVERLKKKGFLS